MRELLQDKIDRQGNELDCSFRLIMAYDIAADMAVMRLDVLMNYQEAQEGPIWRNRQSGTQLSTLLTALSSDCSNLELPRQVMGAEACKTNSVDLANAFRKLADSIDRLRADTGGSADRVDILGGGG